MQKIPWQKIIAILFTCLTGWTFTYLATNIYQQYTLGLFIWLPIVMGITCTLIYTYKNPLDKKTIRNNAFLTLGIFFFGLLLFAWEGIICMLMAAPVGLFFIYLGYLIGYALSKSKISNNTPATIIILMLSVPSLMAFEEKVNTAEDLRLVITSIEINAPPEKVWKNVVTFPQLKEPTEFIFKTGIAYPVDATITGHGAGAVRYCNFSTGRFVEPITVWDEPKLLQFSVDKQPEPMKEISFYDIHPNHLRGGYWVSKQG